FRHNQGQEPILRNHVMVRVGGGWDTLSHYLDKHDPCRLKENFLWLGVGNMAPLLPPSKSPSNPSSHPYNLIIVFSKSVQN
uniref:GAR domain-containing protein n=2 Tax=Marmotini TaxID=337730 RepID=A0A8C9QFY2_SPEDA